MMGDGWTKGWRNMENDGEGWAKVGKGRAMMSKGWKRMGDESKGWLSMGDGYQKDW
jgi:hypothetical protein